MTARHVCHIMCFGFLNSDRLPATSVVWFACAFVMMQGFAGCSPGAAQLAPCASGEVPKNGACVPDNLRVEIGYGNPVTLISEGGELQVRRGFQGLVDALLGFRLTGFRPNAEVSVNV